MLRDEARGLFDQHSPYTDDSLVNHCLRIDELALALAGLRGVRLDEDLLYAGAILHDIGLLVKDPSEPNYLKRGAKLVREQSSGWGLSPEQAKDLDEILLYNHSLTSVPEIGLPAELVRRAVQVEHSLGRRLHGLDRRYYRSVVERYPRLRFNKVLVDFARTTILEDGARTLVTVFLPRFAS